MDDVAEVAAAVGARRRLARGMDAETGDQLGRVGGGRRVGQVEKLVERFPRIVFSLSALSSRGTFRKDRRPCSTQRKPTGPSAPPLAWDGHETQQAQQSRRRL